MNSNLFNNGLINTAIKIVVVLIVCYDMYLLSVSMCDCVHVEYSNKLPILYIVQFLSIYQMAYLLNLCSQTYFFFHRNIR